MFWGTPPSFLSTTTKSFSPKKVWVGLEFVGILQTGYSYVQASSQDK
jgi:hypothetical protein